MTAIESLAACGVKASPQRVAVLDYLMEHHTHPNVDDIYAALHPDYPTLSRTTVYNTLRLLTESGVVQTLSIDERNAHYDADVTPHAHFICTACRTIIDIPLREAALDAMAELPREMQVESTQLYFRGLCPACKCRAEHA